MYKTVKFYLIPVFVLILLHSCTDSDKALGEWDDIIKLSQEVVEVSAEKNTVLITTEGKWWWICEITLNDTLIDIGNVNTTQENFIIEHPEFSIERKNKTEIYIRMNENTTGSQRILLIFLQSGDYFAPLKIIQDSY